MSSMYHRPGSYVALETNFLEDMSNVMFSLTPDGKACLSVRLVGPWDRILSRRSVQSTPSHRRFPKASRKYINSYHFYLTTDLFCAVLPVGSGQCRLGLDQWHGQRATRRTSATPQPVQPPSIFRHASQNNRWQWYTSCGCNTYRAKTLNMGQCLGISS